MKKINKLVFSGICLALCIVLPFLTGQVQQLGNMLCLIHIPVFLCGLICGPVYAAIVGFIAPLLRFALCGMPQIMPTGIAMCFELMTYGVSSGVIYKLLPKKNISIYFALIGGMIDGRIVWGIVRTIMTQAGEYAFTWQAFMAGAFINAIPGIIVQIILIPIIVIAIKKYLNRLE